MVPNYETIIPKNFVNLSKIAMGYILFQQTDTDLFFAIQTCDQMYHKFVLQKNNY